MHMIMTKHGKKELLLQTASQDQTPFFESFMEKATNELKLTPWLHELSGTVSCSAWQQGELSATRKRVASILYEVAKYY